MSRAFLGFVVALSGYMLFLNVSNLDRAKPPVMLFWVLVGGLCVFKLFGRKSSNAG